MIMEIWKDIENYEGLYQVSNLGRVKSLGRVVKRTDGRIRTLKERIRKPVLDTKGYVITNLYKESKGKNFYVHRLVAETFIDNVDNKLEVNHINGVKDDNRLVNLEWNTRSENIQHAVDTGLLNIKGSKCHTSKLTEKDVLEIRDSNLTQIELAKIYGISRPLISMIKNRKTWKHI